MWQTFIKRNEELSADNMASFLQQSFNPIQVSLRAGQFESLEELQAGISEFVQFCDSQSPPGSESAKASMFKLFIADAVTSTATILWSQLDQQKQLQIALNNDKIL